MDTACFLRSSTFNYESSTSYPFKIVRGVVLCEVPPVVRSNLSLFSLLTSYTAMLFSIAGSAYGITTVARQQIKKC